MVAGLEDITSGEISIDGKVVNNLAPMDRDIAMVFQNYALYPHMSVYQNMAFGLRMRKFEKPEIDRRVKQAADVLGIHALLERRPRQLSGGQRQRVALGRAIVRNPRVFLFDEPLSNLDAELRVSMRVEIAKLHNQLGSTMIYVTHDQTEAMTLADKIVVMRTGKIEQAGTPEELYDNPDNLFVAGFIGSPRMNFLRGTLGGGQVKLEAGGALPAGGTDDKVLVGVRPEHFVEAGQGAADVAVTVDVVENLGGTRFVYGTASSGESVVIEARERLGIKAGDIISFGIRPDRAMLFTSSGTRLRNI
jgi:lactose/L-arabinose transport system ATP-binding protein